MQHRAVSFIDGHEDLKLEVCPPDVIGGPPASTPLHAGIGEMTMVGSYAIIFFSAFLHFRSFGDEINQYAPRFASYFHLIL